MMPANGIPVADWSPIALRLMRKPARDYMPGTSGAKVCSARLKSVLSSRGDSHVQWLPVSVFDGDKPNEYFVMHFSEAIEVLDRERTSFVAKSDFPRKPAFKPEIVARYSFFAIPAQFGFLWYVRDDLKKEIVSTELTGFSFDVVSA